MKILWVDDEISVEKVLDYFSLYLTDSEKEKIEEMEGDFVDIQEFLEEETINKIFISSHLNDAIRKVKEEESSFDKIILDINFPLKPNNEEFDLSPLLENSFLGNFSEYPEFIETVSDEKYAGIILNHLIVEDYKERYRWNKKDIDNNIVFLSANEIKYERFEKSITDIYKQAFRYDSDGAGIRFFDKSKDYNDFLNWLQEDEYSIILDRCIKNKKVKKQSIERLKELKKVIETNNLNKSIDDYLSMARKIQENLLNVIPNINSKGVSDILKELHPWKGNGKQFLSDRYYHLANMIQRVSSKNSHEYLEEDENMLKAVIYSLLSMIIKIDKIIIEKIESENSNEN